MSEDSYNPEVRSVRRRGQRASALLIVLLLLAVMTTLMVSNSVVLRRLKVELQLLEQKQQRALEPVREPAPKQAPLP